MSSVMITLLTPLLAVSEVAAPECFDSVEKLMLLATVFVLAVFVGVEIITKIPPTLHTPLMSGSNAISGITVIGAVLLAGMGVRIGGEMEGMDTAGRIFGFLAVILATVNVVGGFVVTHRMLGMFRKKDRKK